MNRHTGILMQKGAKTKCCTSHVNLCAQIQGQFRDHTTTQAFQSPTSHHQTDTLNPQIGIPILLRHYGG